MRCSVTKYRQSLGLMLIISTIILFSTTFAFSTENHHSEVSHDEAVQTEAVHAEEGHQVEGSHEEGGHHGEAESKGWMKTDTYRVLNFAILAIGLFLILRKPVAQALDSRIKGIQDQLEELETKKVAAEKKLADYNDRILKLDDEVKSIVAGYLKQGEEAKERILKEAECAAAKMEDQAKRNIVQEFETAKKKLKTDILDKALLRAEEIVKSKITTEDQDRLVDEYLNKVVT